MCVLFLLLLLLLLQISPDASATELDTLLDAVLSLKRTTSDSNDQPTYSDSKSSDFKNSAIDGLIVSNTTTIRPVTLKSDVKVTEQPGLA
jgi:hypothetical protein